MKDGRFYYLLAALVFVVGGLDFTAFVMQKYTAFGQGLTDSFALTGLGLWWLLAVLIAVLPTIRKRKTGQESVEEPTSQE